MTESRRNNLEKLCGVMAHGMVVIFGLTCLWLYYHQSIADLSLPDPIPYQSDLPLHISMVVEDGWYYSFTAFFYKALYVLCGGSTVGIAVLLATVSVVSVYATQRLIVILQGTEPDISVGQGWRNTILALTLNLVMPCYLRFVGEYRYVSYQSPNIWHNSTYICMRMMALLVLIQYFKLEKKYREGITLREWVCFALLNVICTGVKPSFLLVFSPIVGLYLLADLFRKVPLVRILAFGSALLPSGLVILWQNRVLFGEDTGNGISFHPWYTFSLHARLTKPAVLCSVLFCVAALLVTCKQLRTDKKYQFLVLMAGLGFGEALCLVESGTRSVDGNFLWGYSFCLFMLFTVCAVKWLDIRWGSLRTVIKLGLGMLYCWHLYCGIYFFIELVGGASYWLT
ncbi:MAG: hypothetical protein IJ833_08140 [Lachnospiraceae bacterium]|nr:hypothetical protein [Lachnospiraceae bacterium]